MHTHTQSQDSNQSSITMPTGDVLHAVGVFEVWTTGPDGLPVPGLINRDGTKMYWTTANNAMSSEMLNLVRDVVWRLAANPSGPTGGLWTTGPYIGLATTGINAASTLASNLNELAGGGYVRKAPAWAAGITGQVTNTASPVTWTGGTDISTSQSGISHLFTTPAASGTGAAPNNKLLTFAALNGGPFGPIASGNALNVVYTHTLS
jgi:hypothetical protein